MFDCVRAWSACSCLDVVVGGSMLRTLYRVQQFQHKFNSRHRHTLNLPALKASAASVFACKPPSCSRSRQAHH
eukprot:1181927-Prorocentrum_minimum.AAC.3